MGRLNLSPECPECGGSRSECTNASMDTNGNRIRLRKCADCEESFTTLEIAVPFSFSGADSLKRMYHGTTGPIRRTTDAFSISRGKTPTTWMIQFVKGRASNLCRRGLHELVGDDVYVNPSKGQRVCKPCRRETMKKSYRNRMDKMPASLKAELTEWRRQKSAERTEYKREWRRRKRAAA